MDLVGFGLGTLLLVFVLALIAIGSDKRPKAAAAFCKALREFQRVPIKPGDGVNAEVAALEAAATRLVPVGSPGSWFVLSERPT